MQKPGWQLNDRRFDLYKEDVLARNCRKIRSFALVGLMLGAADTAAELLLRPLVRFPFVGAALLAYFALLCAVGHTLFARGTGHILLAFYLVECPLMAFAVMLGTFFDPSAPSITIMVFLCVLPLFILDRPWRVCAFILGWAAVYAVCCCAAKPLEQFRADMLNLVSYVLIALGVNLFVLYERFECVEALAKYREKAEHDLLTGTYNRGGGDERIQMLLRRGVPGAFLILDIDNFKQINDAFGHRAGDEALVKLTEIIGRDFRMSDVVMRLGGDEFVIYAAGMTDRSLCARKVEELMRDIRAIRLSQAPRQSMTVSVGCLLNRGGETNYQRLYGQADKCLYRAKAAGKNHYEIA